MSRCNRHGREGCLCPDGAYTREEAQQRAGLCGPPAPVIHDRASLTARLTFLAVGLTDAGLSALVERAETLTVDHARPLTSGALAKSQQEREGALMQAALDVGAPDRTNNEGAENARRVEATARFEALKAEAAYEAGCPHHRDVPPGPCARCSWGHEAVEQAAPTAGKVEIPPWRPPCPVCKGAGRWEGWPCGACGNVGPVAAPKPQQGGL